MARREPDPGALERIRAELPIGAAIVHAKHGEGVVRSHIGRKFLSAWFGSTKRAVRASECMTIEAKEAAMSATREELAQAEQASARAMPPGTRVVHASYGLGYVSQHFGDLSLCMFAGRSRAVPTRELERECDKLEAARRAAEPERPWGADLGRPTTPPEQPATTGWRPPPRGY
jgi:hypothetical protein